MVSPGKSGRRLPELFREAGLTDVGAAVYASTYPPVHSRRTVIADLVRSLHPVILGLGLAGERELADVDAAGPGARRRPAHADHAASAGDRLGPQALTLVPGPAGAYAASSA